MVSTRKHCVAETGVGVGEEVVVVSGRVVGRKGATDMAVSTCQGRGKECPLHGHAFGPSAKCTSCGSLTQTLQLPDTSRYYTQRGPHTVPKCECCGDFICFACHGHGWPVTGPSRSLLVCRTCERTCDARASVFKHPPPAFMRDRVASVGGGGVKRVAPDAQPKVMMGAAAGAAAAAVGPCVSSARDAGAGAGVETKRRRVVRIVKKEDDGGSLAHTQEPTRVTTETSDRLVRRTNNRGRLQFMPPLAPEGAPFRMMVQNLVFTADVNAPVRLEQVQHALAKYGAELNVRRFCAVVWRMVLNPGVASTDDLALRGDLGVQPAPPTALLKKCGDGNMLRAPSIDDVRLHDLMPPALRRARTAKVAVLLFRTGKLVCTGARSLAQARYILKYFARVLQHIGYPDACIVRMNITNMVGCAQLSCRINRERLARELSEYATFDAEQFPGVTIKGHPLTGSVTLLVFVSGCVVITGGKSQSSIDAALKRIHPILLHFDVNTPAGSTMPCVSETYVPIDDETAWPDVVASPVAYDAFGVAVTASMRDLRKHRRVRLRLVHPDKHPDIPRDSHDFSVLRAESDFVENLFTMLSDITQREAYNQTGQRIPQAPSIKNAQHDHQLNDILSRKKSAAASAAAAAASADALLDSEDEDEDVALAMEEETQRAIDDAASGPAEEDVDTDASASAGGSGK